MALVCTGGHQQGLHFLAFNQDNSCISMATSEGIRIFNLVTHQICYKNNIGALRRAPWALLRAEPQYARAWASQPASHAHSQRCVWASAACAAPAPHLLPGRVLSHAPVAFARISLPPAMPDCCITGPCAAAGRQAD
jgi:hypothetical protein